MSFRLPLRALILTLLLVGLATAGSINSIVAFGDSLADNGNLYVLDGGIYPPVPPYYGGRGSNGPVAVEYLATALGVPLVDLAVYGATSGVGNEVDGGSPTATGLYGLPGLLPQITMATGLPLDPDALYIIWAGANDAQYINSTGSNIPALVTGAVTNVLTSAATLHAFGAERIMVMGLPDMGLIPYAAAGGLPSEMALSYYSMGFNSAILSNLPFFPYVQYFDSNSVFLKVMANPGAYGFTNVTGQCVPNFAPGETPIPCADPENYFFWDDFHPTTKVHQIVASEVAETIPEPATAVVTLTGLGALVLLRRRIR
jgi:phospholipase/lecithinase/hemolysin